MIPGFLRHILELALTQPQLLSHMAKWMQGNEVYNGTEEEDSKSSLDHICFTGTGYSEAPVLLHDHSLDIACPSLTA